eukprot:4904908-Pleurochrysis_carterae.AAC.1
MFSVAASLLSIRFPECPCRSCDCAPYAWGADCSVSVVTQRICVMNDSRPWFCDKPACIASRDEAYTLDGHSAQCVGEPLDACPRRCDGRGACVCNRGSCRCECYEGFTGKSCSEASAAPKADAPCVNAPCVKSACSVRQKCMLRASKVHAPCACMRARARACHPGVLRQRS